MPFRIGKTLTIECGHLLSKHPGACRFPHGHSRTIEIVVTADALDASDMVCDFKALKSAAEAVVTQYDHAFAINTSDPQYPALRAAYGGRVIGFPQTDPTTEVLARAIFQAVRAQLVAQSRAQTFPVSSNVTLERVRVTETATNWAEYWE
jgi:6-pyruvoyltetrahydropterin/6-carboxytetrahydropterin synthase